MKRLLLILLSAVAFMACSGTKSSQQLMVEDRDTVYKDTYKAYMEAEDKYLNLLFNIERMPDEDELWIMKRDQMKELEQLRTLMLQAREDLDGSIQDWERYLQEVQTETEKANAAPRPANFRNLNDMRTSPGQLLPQEVNSSSSHGF